MVALQKAVAELEEARAAHPETYRQYGPHSAQLFAANGAIGKADQALRKVLSNLGLDVHRPDAAGTWWSLSQARLLLDPANPLTPAQYHARSRSC